MVVLRIPVVSIRPPQGLCFPLALFVLAVDRGDWNDTNLCGTVRGKNATGVGSVEICTWDDFVLYLHTSKIQVIFDNDEKKKEPATSAWE